MNYKCKNSSAVSVNSLVKKSRRQINYYLDEILHVMTRKIVSAISHVKLISFYNQDKERYDKIYARFLKIHNLTV